MAVQMMLTRILRIMRRIAIDYLFEELIWRYSDSNIAKSGTHLQHGPNLTIINQGTCISHKYRLGIYLSEDPVITRDDRILSYVVYEIEVELVVGSVYTIPLEDFIGIPGDIA